MLFHSNHRAHYCYHQYVVSIDVWPSTQQDHRYPLEEKDDIILINVIKVNIGQQR